MLMDKRSRAFSLRNSEIYAECIHENYRVTNKDGKTLGKQDLVNIFKKTMAIIDSISFGETRRYIYVSDYKANVIAVSLIEVRVGDYSVVYEAKEVFGLTNTLMGWRITRESGFDLLSGMKILNE